MTRLGFFTVLTAPLVARFVPDTPAVCNHGDLARQAEWIKRRHEWSLRRASATTDRRRFDRHAA